MTEGIKLNFSDDEKKSEGRSIEPIPTGEYLCNIVKVELQKIKKQTKDDGNPNPNFGKPFWSIQLAVQEGKYKDRRVFTNVMLFQGKDGTLSNLAQLMKATNRAGVLDSGVVPPGEQLLGDQVIAVVQKTVDKYKTPRGATGDDVIMKNEVRGFKNPSAGVGNNASGANSKVSLLP